MADQVSGLTPNKPTGPMERDLPMEANTMRDQLICVVTTAEVGQVVSVVEPKPARPTLAPDLRKALKESFAKYEVAYRYLGR